MKPPKSRALSAKETRRLLQTTGHTLDDDLSRVCLCEVFDLAEGGVLLLFENGKGRLYESKDEMLALLKEVEEEALKGPKSIAADLPQGRAFADQVPELIGKLAILLNIDAAQLDRSEVSLENVDKALRRLRPQQLLTPEVFAPLTAYVGEVIRGATGGSWEMRRGPDPGQSWEPWIVDPAGRSCAPFLIYKELLEYRKSASLRGWVVGTLATWEHRPTGPTGTISLS